MSSALVRVCVTACHRMSLWIPGTHLLFQTAENVQDQSRIVDGFCPSVRHIAAYHAVAVRCLISPRTGFCTGPMDKYNKTAGHPTLTLYKRSADRFI
jgi:hypothetical protein